MARRARYFDFDLDIEITEAIKKVRQVLPENSGLRLFIEALATLIVKEGRAVSTKEFVAYAKNVGIGSSSALITSRVQQLVEEGCAEEKKTAIGSKPVIMCTISTLYPIIHGEAKPKKISTRVSEPQIQLGFQNIAEDWLPITSTNGDRSRIDALFLGVLDSVMRVDGRDKRLVISSPYKYGKEEVKITASTSTNEGAGISFLTDCRAMRSLEEMFCSAIEDEYGPIKHLDEDVKKQISGDVILDIYKLCREMGLDQGTQSAESVRKILARLVDTKYEINAEGAEDFKRKFLGGADSASIRFLTECYTWKGPEAVNGTSIVDFKSRVYKVRLHSSVVAALLNDQRFSAHPGLRSEKVPIAHRLNSSCRIVVGVRKNPKREVVEFLLDEFWERVMPSSLLKNFKSSVENYLEKTRIDEQGEIRLNDNTISTGPISKAYGYYFQLDYDEARIRELMRIRKRASRKPGVFHPILRIWRDSEDPYVGDNSDHNMALRRQFNAVARTGVGTELDEY